MLTYRTITAADDESIAEIIRTNLEKFHLDIPGTAYFDPELNHLSEFYLAKPDKRTYYIALDEKEQVAGGVGVAEFAGIANCAELQKLYLAEEQKGNGYSKEMVNLVINWAKAAGYKHLYLETHTNLEVAIKLYERMGFRQINKPESVMHSTMNRFFIKEL